MGMGIYLLWCPRGGMCSLGHSTQVTPVTTIEREIFIKSVIAKFLNKLGIKPQVSSGICGGITYGYGKLDNNGYWEYLLKVEYD